MYNLFLTVSFLKNAIFYCEIWRLKYNFFENIYIFVSVKIIIPTIFYVKYSYQSIR